MKIAVKLSCALFCMAMLYQIYAKQIDLNDSRVDLPWKEFKGILDKVSEPVNRPLPDSLLPSTEYLITSAVINGKVINRKAARFTVKVNIHIPQSASLKTNGWISVPIGSNQSRNSEKGVLEKAELDGIQIPLRSSEDSLSVLISKQGNHNLILSYYCQVINEEGNYKIAVSIPRAASAQLDFEVPQIHADLWVNGLKRPVQLSKNGTVFSSVVSLEEELLLRYSQIGEEFTDDDNGNQIAPKSFATSGLLVTIKENRINYQYRVDYQIWHQKRNLFSIEIPESLQIENVQGTGISEWKVEKAGKATHLRVYTTFSPERNYTINVEFNQKLKTAESQIQIPVLKVIDCNRANGYISITASEAIEVLAEDNQENLSEVEPDEIPGWLRLQNNALMQFKFTHTLYLLNLQIKRHTDVPVLVAIADEALLTGVMTEEGYSLVKYRYFIRNNHKQYLRVSMPQDWALWSALIDGEAVMPASSNTGNGILIPLKKLSKTDDGAGFTLELVYWNQQQKFQSRGKYRFEIPVIDINCQKMYGEIYLPERYQYSGFSGPVQLVKSYSNRYISDSDNRYAPVSQKQFQNIAKGLPVEIEIPKTGKPLRFTKGLTIAGEKSGLVCKYTVQNSWIRYCFGFMLWLLLPGITFLSVLSILKNRTKKGIIIKSTGTLFGLIMISIVSKLFSLSPPPISAAVFIGVLFAVLAYTGSRDRRVVTK